MYSLNSELKKIGDRSVGISANSEGSASILGQKQHDALSF